MSQARNPLDVEAIAKLVEENHRLSAENESMAAELGAAQLRIAVLERQVAPAAGKDHMREFEDMRATALANGKRGVFP